MIEYLPLVLTGLGLTASIIYYASILRNQNKTRQRDWKTFDEWEQKYGPDTNPDAWANYLYITRIYNLAGIMLQEKAADPELIFKLFAPTAIIRVWEQFEKIIIDDRKKSNYYDHYGPFEYIYNEAKRRFPEVTKIS